MAEHARGGMPPCSLPPPQQGDANGTELKLAPSSQLGPLGPPAGLSALGLFRRKLPFRRGPPPQLSAPQLLPESDLQLPCGGVCLSPGPPSPGATARPSRFLHLGPAQGYPAEQMGSRWVGLPPAALHPPSQPAGQGFSSRGDLALAPMGFLPSGLVWLSAPLDPEGGAPQAPRLPPNICILALAMMIAGIPTVPVPGVREEDMILAAQNFMAGGPADTEGALRRGWAAGPRLGLPCRRDKQQQQQQQQSRGVAGRSLLPLFLAQLEK
ncbi:spermatogenesis-associated protein 25 [Paroedura picta]|uniref:spermatogenesis-associated protein 25 n=1 Tax=Paroedura picta TaxID=143630 RepID=UPI004056FFA1